MFCYHVSFEEFVEEIEEQYDLIISNPPFYNDTYKSNDEQRDLARFTDAMPFRHLIESASRLFSVVIPFSEENDFIVLASKEHLFPNRILRVKGSPSSEIKRSLIEFSFIEMDAEISELVIETERHHYTEAYINLTKDFYLKM